jgi:meso-butanediol dehydrogenase/(S,S)-butanediol dehydrogenase/diacetyl reductase
MNPNKEVTMSKQLSGKNIIVTGAGSPTGIGAGVADGLAERGANVVVADIDLKAAEDVAGKIATRHSVKTIAVKVDVSNRAEVEALVAKTVDAFGQLDVMFNNAGIIEHASFLEITESGWHKLMNVNALGVLIGIQVAAKQMIAQGKGGKIINTSSIASRQGYPAFAHYSASKWAVAALSQAAARQFAEHRINVNCIAPGVVKTALWDQLDREFINKGLTKEPEQAINEFSLGIPLGRYSVAKDLVGTAAFLASSDSDYITGQNIQCDGGMIMA